MFLFILILNENQLFRRRQESANTQLRQVCVPTPHFLSLIDLCSNLIRNHPEPFKHYMMDGIQRVAVTLLLLSLLFNQSFFLSAVPSLLTFLYPSSSLRADVCLSLCIHPSGCQRLCSACLRLCFPHLTVTKNSCFLGSRVL